jgi:hypothetical protein
MIPIFSPRRTVRSTPVEHHALAVRLAQPLDAQRAPSPRALARRELEAHHLAPLEQLRTSSIFSSALTRLCTAAALLSPGPGTAR